MLVSKTLDKTLAQLARLQVAQHGLLEFDHAPEFRRAGFGNFLLLTRFGHAMNRQSQTSSQRGGDETGCNNHQRVSAQDRKSTRLNSSHVAISYAVFCFKKKRH